MRQKRHAATAISPQLAGRPTEISPVELDKAATCPPGVRRWAASGLEGCRSVEYFAVGWEEQITVMDAPRYQATALFSAYAAIERLPVVVLLDNVRSLYNVGSFFRTADAVRAQGLVLSGITGAPPAPRIAKTALGAEQAVRWETRSDPIATLDQLAVRGYELAAIETSLRAVDLFDWRPAFPVCIIFGHEVDGVQPSVLARCDTHVRIPTLGSKPSLNVATAGGVVLYERLRKYRRLIEGTRAGADPGVR